MLGNVANPCAGKGCISQDRATSVGGDLFLWPLILDLDFQWISRLCLLWVRLLPKLARNHKCIEIERFPPGDFIARLMKLPMMYAAEWNGELVADFNA